MKNRLQRHWNFAANYIKGFSKITNFELAICTLFLYTKSVGCRRARLFNRLESPTATLERAPLCVVAASLVLGDIFFVLVVAPVLLDSLRIVIDSLVHSFGSILGLSVSLVKTRSLLLHYHYRHQNHYHVSFCCFVGSFE